MIKGIDVNQRLEYVSKYDDAEPKTVFIFRPLTAEEKNNLSDDSGTVKLVGTKIFDFLEKTIVEIRNFPIAGTIREQLNSISDENIVVELIQESGKLSNMTRQDQKNS